MTHKIMVLNAQDLFLFMDKHGGGPVSELNEIKWQLMSSSLFSNKPKEKCELLAYNILETDADLVMVTEVGGAESLSNFAKFLLNDKYQCFTLPSNSDRGIDLGYLVKKSSGWECKIQTHVHYKLPEPAYRFSRDVLRLDVSEDGKLKFIALVVHIKSKLDMQRKDFEGRTRRVLEVKGLLDIYQELEKLNVPVLIGGDFNGHAGEIDTEEEFKQIYERTDLKDVALLSEVPEEERFSYVYFNRGGNRFVQQIDYLFISEKYSGIVVKGECFFPRYKNLHGAPLAIPQKYEHKHLLPSDHYPFLATLNL
jgi:endonuclease/exonuclease/phosphatase family metal-dependent hydrolase